MQSENHLQGFRNIIARYCPAIIRGGIQEATVQTAHLLERKKWSRSIGYSSDVKIGAKNRLQASLTPFSVPTFPLSELLRRYKVSLRN